MSIELVVETPVFETLPNLAVYAVRISNMRVALASLDTTELLGAAVAQCKVPAESVAENEVVAAWRDAYGRMGVKPSKFRSSIEALLRRAVKRAELALPIPAVNLYNACSINNVSPMGAYDVARLPGSRLSLRLAVPGADHFDPLGSDPNSFPLNDRLIVYAVGGEIMCWGVNCRDAKTAALDADSDSAVFFSEAVKAEHSDAAQSAIVSLTSVLRPLGARCGEVARADCGLPSVGI